MRRKTTAENKSPKFAAQSRKNRPKTPRPMVDPDEDHMAPGIIHPDHKRDLLLLDRVLPAEIPPSVRQELPIWLTYVAISYGVDTSTNHWLAETMFHLALSNSILGITGKKRGRQHGNPNEVKIELTWLISVFKIKGRAEADLKKKISLANLATKITFLEWLVAGKQIDEIDSSSQEFIDSRIPIYNRILRLNKLYPDIARIPYPLILGIPS